MSATLEMGDIIRLGKNGDIVYIWNGKKKLVFDKRGDHYFVNGVPFGLDVSREDRINVKSNEHPVQQWDILSVNKEHIRYQGMKKKSDRDPRCWTINILK